jgi:hypothetical protein
LQNYTPFPVALLKSSILVSVVRPEKGGWKKKMEDDAEAVSESAPKLSKSQRKAKEKPLKKPKKLLIINQDIVFWVSIKILK